MTMNDTKEQRDALERSDSLNAFIHPAGWPRWPYLTIKNRTVKNDHGPKCAVLVDFGNPGEAYDVHFIDGNVYLIDQEMVNEAKTTPKIDPAQLIADGWVVD